MCMFRICNYSGGVISVYANLYVAYWIFLCGNTANPTDGKPSVRYAETAYASLLA